MRQVTGEPEQLELEREREWVERRLCGRPARNRVETLEEARQRREGTLVALLLREEAQHRLGAHEPDTEPVGLVPHLVMRP